MTDMDNTVELGDETYKYAKDLAIGDVLAKTADFQTNEVREVVRYPNTVSVKGVFSTRHYNGDDLVLVIPPVKKWRAVKETSDPTLAQAWMNNVGQGDDWCQTISVEEV